MKNALWLSLLLGTFASAAKPAPAPKVDAMAQQAMQARLKRLISHVLKTGEDTVSSVATMYGLTEGPTIRAKKLEKQSADKRVHSFTVAYLDGGGGIEVVKLDLSCDEDSATVWYFATSAGALEKANALVGGKPRQLDPKDPKLLKLFTTELQYHLKPGVWLD